MKSIDVSKSNKSAMLNVWVMNKFFLIFKRLSDVRRRERNAELRKTRETEWEKDFFVTH